jgi:hypothetical protein
MPVKTACKTADAVMSIWKRRVRVGDKVYIASTQPTITDLEGTLTAINLDECFAEIRNAAGLTYSPLLDTLYVEVLCVNKHRKSEDGTAKEAKEPKAGASLGCADVSRNIWSRVPVGASVFVSIGDVPFVTTVEEVDLKNCIVALRNESGITYVPITNIQQVRVAGVAPLNPA